MLRFTKTEIDGCFIIEYDIYHDSRGYFTVTFNEDEFFSNLSIFTPVINKFVQENESYSSHGTIRGLHFQKDEHAQSKLVRCVDGHVLDVIVDIRKNSRTFGKHIRIDLKREYNRMVYVPRGCAHGFSTLSRYALFQYKVDNYYNKQSEGGIIYNDPVLNIDWGVEKSKELVSEKDLLLSKFLEL